jgi:hypothetical protein
MLLQYASWHRFSILASENWYVSKIVTNSIVSRQQRHCWKHIFHIIAIFYALSIYMLIRIRLLTLVGCLGGWKMWKTAQHVASVQPQTCRCTDENVQQDLRTWAPWTFRSDCRPDDSQTYGHTLWEQCTHISIRYFQVQVVLRPTVSRPVCLGVGPPCGAYDQIFFLL